MTSTLTPRQHKLAERKAAEARRLAVQAAVTDEITRFNAAIRDGKMAILHTTFGPYVVLSVNSDWWCQCKRTNSNGGYLSERSFAGCNDYAWEDLLRQVGEPRHPLFMKREVVV